MIVVVASAHKNIILKTIHAMSRYSLDDLVRDLAVNNGLSQTVVKSLVTELFYEIKTLVAKGNDVSIPKVGLFTRSRAAAYTARNPKTGAPVRVPAKNRVKFRAYDAFKCAVN